MTGDSSQVNGSCYVAIARLHLLVVAFMHVGSTSTRLKATEVSRHAHDGIALISSHRHDQMEGKRTRSSFPQAVSRFHLLLANGLSHGT